MAETITYQRIIHKAQARIQLNFPYQANWIAKVKSIPDRKWSQSRKCWHIPDTQESLDLLKTVFPQAQPLEKPTVDAPIVHNSIAAPDEDIPTQDNQEVYLGILTSKLFISMKKQAIDVAFIKSLHYSRWNNHDFRWEITHTPENLQAIRDHFGCRLQEQEVSVNQLSQSKIHADYHQILIQPT